MIQRNGDVELTMWVQSLVGKPFVWGETDCCTIVAGALLRLHGVDYRLPVYRSRDDAKRIVATMGGLREQLVRLGAVEVPVNFERTGDIVVLAPVGEEFTDGAGLVVGSQVITTSESDGVRVVPLAVVRRVAGMTTLRVESM